MENLQQYWRNLVQGHAPALLEVYVLAAVQIAFFWVPSTVYLLIDLLFPSFSNKHKIQSERFQPSWLQIKECVWHVFVNNTASISLQVVLALLRPQNSIFRVNARLPALRTVAYDFVFAAIVREVLFYFSHRAFHHGALYKRFHKQHHKFTAPMAFAAQYAHPLEHLVANTLPVILPHALLRAHVLSFSVWLAWSLFETASAHSGYDFFRFPAAKAHDLHHEKFNINYGGGLFMDRLFGTDKLKSPKKKGQ